MTLIEEVNRLKILEKNATPGPWEYRPSGISKCGHEYPDCICADGGGLMYHVGDDADTQLIIDLRNVASSLLDILDFREGDAMILGCFLEFMQFYNPNGHLNDRGDVTKITNRQAVDCLRRLAGMASKMEAKQE